MPAGRALELTLASLLCNHVVVCPLRSSLKWFQSTCFHSTFYVGKYQAFSGHAGNLLTLKLRRVLTRHGMLQPMFSGDAAPWVMNRAQLLRGNYLCSEVFGTILVYSF